MTIFKVKISLPPKVIFLLFIFLIHIFTYCTYIILENKDVESTLRNWHDYFCVTILLRKIKKYTGSTLYLPSGKGVYKYNSFDHLFYQPHPFNKIIIWISWGGTKHQDIFTLAIWDSASIHSGPWSCWCCFLNLNLTLGNWKGNWNTRQLLYLRFKLLLVLIFMDIDFIFSQPRDL